MSDTTDDLWFLTEGESEQVSVEMKEAALEEGSGGEGEAPPEDDDGGGKEEKADREVEVCFMFLSSLVSDRLILTYKVINDLIFFIIICLLL